MSEIMKTAYLEFIRLLEAGSFFEAHEALEVLWFPIRHGDHPEKNLLRGLINASVSFELIRRGRPQAARRVWRTYKKYLALIESFAGENRPLYDACVVAVENVYKEFEDIYG